MSSGSQDPCRRTDGQTDRHIVKPVVAFLDFVNAPKMYNNLQRAPKFSLRERQRNESSG